MRAARAAEDAARARAAAADRALGGADGGGDRAQGYGAAARAKIDAAVSDSKARINRLYAAVDPTGTWALPSTVARVAAKDLSAEIDPASGLKLTPAEQHWVDTIKAWPGIVKFKTASQARQGLGEAIRTARVSGTPSEVRRLTILRGAVDQTIDEAVGQAAKVEAPHVVAGNLARAESMVGRLAQHAANDRQAVFTNTGRRVDVEHEIVEASKLVPSHRADMLPNPDYPAELQPRDRTRAASEVQVAKMAGNLQPERLGASTSALDGAPIVGPDGVVESGNARTMAIRRAYAEGGPSAAAYRAWVAQHGVDVSGMREPMMVRRRLTELSPADRVAFTREANTSPGLSLGAGERARMDAAAMSDQSVGQYQSGDVTSASNAPFVRAVVRDLAAHDPGAFSTGTGALSVDGATRIRNALLMKAYGSPDLVHALAEQGDEDIRAFGAALTDAAGSMAQLRAGIAAGVVDPAVDLSPALLEVTRVVQAARSKGISLADTVGQADAFNPVSDLADQILRATYGADLRGRIVRGRLAAYLRDYADSAAQQSVAPRLFGQNASASEILKAVGERHGRSDAGQPASGASPGSTYSRGGSGATGPEVRRSGMGQDGPSGASQGRGDGSAGIAADAPLQANLGRPDVDAYAAARASRLAHAERFAGAPSDVLAAGRNGARYSVEDSQVAARFWKSGDGGAAAAQSLIRSLGSREAAEAAVGDFAAHELRAAKGVVRGDGSLYPAKFNNWLAAHNAALSAFPGLRARFGTAAKAVGEVDALSAQRDALASAAVKGAEADRKGQLTAHQNSAAGFYLDKGGDTKDPLKAIGSLLKSANPSADAADLMRMSSGDLEAQAGIRRNLVDYLVEIARSTAEAGATGETQISKAALDNVLNDPRSGKAIAQILEPEQVQTLRAIVADLDRAGRAIHATKVPGSPGTAADSHALGHGGGLGSMMTQMAFGEVGGEAIAHASGAHGPIAGTVRLAATLAPVGINAVVTAARKAGMKKVDDLLTAAVLNPELGRTLLLRPVAAARPAIAQKAAGLIANLSVSGAVQGGNHGR